MAFALDPAVLRPMLSHGLPLLASRVEIYITFRQAFYGRQTMCYQKSRQTVCDQFLSPLHSV